MAAQNSGRAAFFFMSLRGTPVPKQPRLPPVFARHTSAEAIPEEKTPNPNPEILNKFEAQNMNGQDRGLPLSARNDQGKERGGIQDLGQAVLGG